MYLQQKLTSNHSVAFWSVLRKNKISSCTQNSVLETKISYYHILPLHYDLLPLKSFVMPNVQAEVECLIFKSWMLHPTDELIVMSMPFLKHCSTGVNLPADHPEGSLHSTEDIISQKHILEGHLLTFTEQPSWHKGLTSKNQCDSKRFVFNKRATSFLWKIL